MSLCFTGQERYKAEVIDLNGPEFDWLHSPIDVRALYACSCGQRHGKWAIFNGVIDDREALAEVKNDRASAMAAKQRRQEEDERIRKEANDSHSAKEYAQNMLEWGIMVQLYNENMHEFIEVRNEITLYFSLISVGLLLILIQHVSLNDRIWLNTLGCLPLQFLLPRLLLHFLRHLAFQCLQINLLKM